VNWLDVLIAGAIGGLIVKHLEWTVPFWYWQHRIRLFFLNRSLGWKLTKDEKKRIAYEKSYKDTYDVLVLREKGNRINPKG